MSGIITGESREKTLDIKSAVQSGENGYPLSKIQFAENQIVNTDSSVSRTLRIMSEFEEFPQRMKQFKIRGTFLFFGSARAVYEEDYNERMGALLEKKANAVDDEAITVNTHIEALGKLKWSSIWMEKTERLAFLLTEWSLSDEGREAGMWCKSRLRQSPVHNTVSHCHKSQLGSLCNVTSTDTLLGADNTYEQPLIVCTGGGPGFMEAANKGAYCAKGMSMGVHITLPFETSSNSYITPGLNFRMDYFFSRKFWEVLCAKTMICSPGAMGTLDEMFEVLTLIQCGKCTSMPIVLLGKDFWEDIVNWRKLSGYGLISQKEVDNICFTDDPQEAFEFIVGAIKKEANNVKLLGKL